MQHTNHHQASNQESRPIASLSEKAYLSIQEWVFMTGICRSSTYVFIAEGALKTVKIGKRRLIPASEVRDFVTRESQR
jgi:excisionase family DNA binding protein